MSSDSNNNFHHLYRVSFDMVDSDTGEVLTRNKKCEILTDSSECPEMLRRWLESFYRGLRQGHSLSFVVTAEKWKTPSQPTLF